MNTAGPRIAAERVHRTVKEHPTAATAVGLIALVLFSLSLRSHALNAKFWIDEGLSVGIASHGLTDIPSILRQDGSPPLYYMLLHVWTSLVGGDGESRTHLLSLIFALLMVPAAYWSGNSLFDRRTGWACAALATVNPFLTFYAQETRMYSLVALLGLLSITTFALVFAERKRRALPYFAVVMALVLYSHNWGLFFAAGTFVAFVFFAWRAHGVERRALIKDGLLGYGAIAILYAPWLPTLYYQSQHTGAPWARAPKLEEILNCLQMLGGGSTIAFAGACVAFAGVTVLWHRTESMRQRDAMTAILIAGLSGIALAWISSQISPAWASRYFAVFVGPVILLFGVGLVRHGKLGLIVLLLVLYISADSRERELRNKGASFKTVTSLQQDYLGVPRTGSAALVRDDDIVVNLHPEHTPVVRYYFDLRFPTTKVRWYDAMGKVRDTRIFDWRDAQERLTDAGPRRMIRTKIKPALKPGQHLIVMMPLLRPVSWNAPWTRLVKHRALQWRNALNKDPEFRLVLTTPKYRPRGRPRGVRALVYERVAPSAPRVP
ncbi:MAG TPA: glycosyltransferase family 39 protein [Baekduia sp.]|nr:glycosyltransferase family 39 protein [Baekduia sp.]